MEEKLIYIDERTFRLSLEVLSKQCLDAGNDEWIKFTDRDLRNVSFIFNHILGNYTHKTLISMGVGREYLKSETFSKRIESFKKYMFYATNIDTTELFKRDVEEITLEDSFLQKTLNMEFEFAIQSDSDDIFGGKPSFKYNYSIRDIQNIYIIFLHVTYQYARQNDLTLGMDTQIWLNLINEVIELSTGKTVEELFELKDKSSI